MLCNIAMDISINQMIDPKYKSPEFLHINSFGELNLEQHQDTDYYYQKLKKEKEDNPDGKLGEFMKDAEGQYTNSMANHEYWKQFEELSESDQKLVQKQVEYQVKDVANQLKSRGLIPGELSGIIDKLFTIEEAKFNWKAYLRRFAGGSNKIFTKKTRRKQSSRFIDSPGLKIKQKKKILVFNDSSGSVSDKDYTEFMNEIYHIHKTGTEVTFADFDTQVSNVRVYKGNQSVQRNGYGGTDFNPPVEYYNKNKSKYCSCIIFTDGYCSAPDIKPNGKLLWVICSNGDDKIELPGWKIKLN